MTGPLVPQAHCPSFPSRNKHHPLHPKPLISSKAQRCLGACRRSRGLRDQVLEQSPSG